MTISSASVRNDYANTSGGNAFPYTFKIFSDNDISVLTTDSEGREIVKTLGVDYTVTGVNSETGGNVVFGSPVSAGTEVHIVCVLDRTSSGTGIPLTQSTDLVNETGFFQDRIEDRFDRLCRQLQIVADETARSVKLTVGSNPEDYTLELPAPRAGYLIGSTDGTSFTNVTTVSASDAISGNWTVDRFVDGVGFTGGVSTVVTLSKSVASSASILVFFDGVCQHRNTYDVTGSTLTFTSPIPLGVLAVEVRIPTTLAIGVPGDETVGPSKMAGGTLDKSIRFSFASPGIKLAVGGNSANSAFARGLQIGGGLLEDGSEGVIESLEGHATWRRFVPSRNESSIEVAIHTTAACGEATAAIGTNQITYVTGSPFDLSWTGKKLYFGSGIYIVLAVVGNTITLSDAGGGAFTFSSSYNEVYRVAYIYGSGICSVSGATVNRISGDPFVLYYSNPSFVFKIGGVARTVSGFTDDKTISLSSSIGVIPSTTYEFWFDVNDQITCFRLHGTNSDSENLSLYTRYDGYWIEAQYGGYGKHRPIRLTTGEMAPGVKFQQLVLWPNGDTCIGGDYSSDGLRVLGTSPSGRTNFIVTRAADTGYGVYFQSAGGDTNVNFGIDSKGEGSFVVSNGDFSRVAFKAHASSGATSWVAAGATPIGPPFLASEGGATNIDLLLTPKGAGMVSFGTWTASGDVAVNGYITIKDSSGVTRKIPTIP